MTEVTEYVIEVDKLTKRYGDLLAVNDISFTVNKGEVFALLGPNGAGKTTTVEIMDTIRMLRRISMTSSTASAFSLRGSVRSTG
jgi:ABC-2 type transport system ATP-binding protein